MRQTIANWFVSTGRSLGSTFGLQTAVVLSDHSIKVRMESPDKDTRAWDTNLYGNGNVFVEGYANPIKPRVEYHEQLENPNTVEVTEGDTDDTEASEDDADDTHVQLISSGRYRDYMRQDLISQLLTPDAQWKLIAYGVLALGVLQFFAICVTLYGTGAF